MLSPGPKTTLLLLLALAGTIFGAGWRLARQERTVYLDRDRAPLRHFASEAEREVRRLEALYEGHLARLARTLPADAFLIRREADRIVGVQQYSLLHRSGTTNDLHVVVSAPGAGEHLLEPAFAASHTGLARTVVLESATLFAADETRDGWIDEPGKPLLFWYRRMSDEVAVLTINRRDVEAAASRWLASWAAASFEPVRAGGGPDEFRHPSGPALAHSGEAVSTRANLLLPVRSRIGDWEIASWDRPVTEVVYSVGELFAAASLAVLVALLGCGAYVQQRRATAAAAQRVSFVNRVSHELRSPLTNILLNVDLAAEALEEAPELAHGRLLRVQEEARRLGRLIDNVLTFSRQEQGGRVAEPRACLPASVIAGVVEQFAPSFARRALKVRCSGRADELCLLDADAFAQIIGNLLSNVEKYVPGGMVCIESEQRGGQLTILVADEGPGIPPEAMERVFRPFERLENRVTEGATGTGLGLSIARDLAIGLGGSLRLLPCERGATFQLTLPAPPAPAIASVA